MKPKGFALKVVLRALVIAVVAGAGVGFAGPSGHKDPDTGYALPRPFYFLTATER